MSYQKTFQTDSCKNIIIIIVFIMLFNSIFYDSKYLITHLKEIYQKI
jgi:hypothetical protein